MRPISLNRQLRLALLALASTLVLSAGTWSFAYAEGTQTYSIQAEDTLLGIATKVNVPTDALPNWLDEVVHLNNLKSADSLSIGQKLLLPSTAGTASFGTSTSLYKVASGDTLSGIADKLSIAPADFAAWTQRVLKLNNLASPEALRAGDTLLVPASKTGPASSSASTASTAATAAGAPSTSATKLASITYVVQAGESFYSIAQKLNVAPDDFGAWLDKVAALTQIKKTDMLELGEVLLVPSGQAVDAPAATTPTASPSTTTTNVSLKKTSVKYTVRAGDTLSDIAASVKVPSSRQPGWIDEVLTLNGLASADLIVAGQELQLPADSVLPGMDAPKPAATTTQTTTTASGDTQAQATTSAPAQSTPPPPIAAPPVGLVKGSNGSCFYTVQRGDTWDSVAQKLGVSKDKQAAWIDGVVFLNSLPAGTLPVGDALRLLC